MTTCLEQNSDNNYDDGPDDWDDGQNEHTARWQECAARMYDTMRHIVAIVNCRTEKEIRQWIET